jgi:hypothetical protein
MRNIGYMKLGKWVAEKTNLELSFRDTDLQASRFKRETSVLITNLCN